MAVLSIDRALLLRRTSIEGRVPCPSPTKSGAGMSTRRQHGGASLGHATHQITCVGALRIKPTNAFALGVVLWLLMGSFVSAQPVVFADAGATGPVHDGSSWCNAYTALQDALAHADASGGTVTEIRVAVGVYKPDQGVDQTPGDRAATFQLLNGVALRGGFAGCGAPDPGQRDIAVYETILSGDLNGDDEPGFLNNDENTFNVVNGSITDATAVLEGFTIAGGRASGARVGGGMSNFRGSPTVVRCTFTRNSSMLAGGGIYNRRSDPRLIECVFIENRASSPGGYGGAMYNSRSEPVLVNCTFHRNVAHNAGGAIYNENFSGPTLINSLFSANVAIAGGGIYNHRSSPILTNCTLVGNLAFLHGGGILNFIGSAPTLTNCILWDNRDGDGMGESAQVFNSDSRIVSTPVIDHSCIRGLTGLLGGIGNIGEEPLFVDPGYWDDGGIPDFPWDDRWVEGNHRLTSGSPCIDAGDNGAVPSSVTTDLDGNPRFFGDPLTPDTGLGTAPIVDMGAYEFQAVLLDIKPRKCPNRVKARDRKPLEIAVVGTVAFDVTQIDIDSVVLTRADGVGGSVTPRTRGRRRGIKIKDAAAPFAGDLCDCHRRRKDRVKDLLLKFDMRELADVLELGNTRRGELVTLTLSGMLLDGTPFSASDCIVMR